MGGGRVFAGSPASFNTKIGEVPSYIYLLDDDVDGLGFSLRFVSLSSDVEVLFNPYDAADYNLFNVRYLLLASDVNPPVKATLLNSAGRWRLWAVATTGYLQVVDTSTTITANRIDIGSKVAPFLQSSMPAEGVVPTVAFAGGRAATPTRPTESRRAEPDRSGAVLPPGRRLVRRRDHGETHRGGDVEGDVRPRLARDRRRQAGKDRDARAELRRREGVARNSPHRLPVRGLSALPVAVALGAVTLVVLAVAPRWRRRRANRSPTPPAAAK